MKVLWTLKLLRRLIGKTPSNALTGLGYDRIQVCDSNRKPTDAIQRIEFTNNRDARHPHLEESGRG